MSLYVNNSLLTLLASCETRTWLRWGNELVMHTKQEPGPMEVGQVLHVALEAWVLGRTQAEILSIFDIAWFDVIGEALPRQERLHFANVRLCLSHWLNNAPQRVELKVLQTEHTFEVFLGRVLGRVRNENIIYYGTPDTLIEWHGERYILDHKSTGMLDELWGEQWTMNTGLQGYVWGLRELGYDVKGAFVNGIEIRRLPPWDGNMAKKCQTHKVKYAECQSLHVTGRWVGPLVWSGARLEQWRKDALQSIERLQDIRDEAQKRRLQGIRMDGQFRWPGCNGGVGRAPCPYRSFCQAGRPLQGLTQMMIHEDWRRETAVGEEEEA